jgi:hypothetical protein
VRPTHPTTASLPRQKIQRCSPTASLDGSRRWCAPQHLTARPTHPTTALSPRQKMHRCTPTDSLDGPQ